MNLYKKSINWVTLSLMVTALFSQPIFAFKFNPMTQEIALNQKQNRAV